MARAPIFYEVKDANGNYVSGASVTVRNRRTGATATLYNAETAGSTIANPLTSNAAGQVTAWVDRGSYWGTVSGTGITTYTIPLEEATAEDATGSAPWIPAELAGTGATFVGKSIVNTSESTVATTHPNPPASNLATPDRVSGVTVTTAGVIMVMFKAIYFQATASTVSWVVYLNTTQVKACAAAAPASVAFTGSTLTDDEVIHSGAGSLNAFSTSAVGNATDITTGQTLGAASYPGWMPIFVDAGTYDVSISLRSTTGSSVGMKNRKLWVWSWAAT